MGFFGFGKKKEKEQQSAQAEETRLEAQADETSGAENAQAPAGDAEQAAQDEKKQGLFSRLWQGLSKTRGNVAGRLHNKKNLMEELRKISRVITREYEEAEVRTLLVIDATTGQNGLQQAREFSEVADVSGIVLTKLDGTAKGGIAVAIMDELKLPVLYIGVGEGIEDLQAFDANAFVDAIF